MAVIIGKPLSYLQCDKIAEVADNISSAYAFATKLSSYLSNLDGKLQYGTLIGASKGVCLEAKSIWGLSIALWYVLLFSFVFFNVVSGDSCGLGLVLMTS